MQSALRDMPPHRDAERLVDAGVPGRLSKS
jgi:hypothetical protein